MAEFFNEKAFNPEAFAAYIDTIPKTRLNRLIQSKAVRPNSRISGVFSSQTGSYYATLPMFGRIGGDAQNYDGKTDITSNTVDTFTQGVVVYGRANSWTENDFSEDITSGIDFLGTVGMQISDYWQDVDQDTLLSILTGIFGMTGTGNNDFVNGHTYDITANDTGMMDATTLNSAIQQASGDKKDKFSMVIMPSIVATNLENLKLLSYFKYTDANGIERDLNMATWNGRLVIIDDNMPVDITDADNPVYTVYALGDGAFDYADIGAAVPFEMDRNPAVNGGQTMLYSRQRKCFAPYGISFTKSSVASLSPTNAEFEMGSNWELVNNGQGGAKRKVFPHKDIPIARILCKG